ncbi:hypothetical protein DN730_03900 [Marinomonas piezotolerans]|uniref:Secreted protein n=1 Tax=Marinomonas piezotolerans TaxID=2213058 RepID=A0A370UEJ3_9GAMM|nr:hypothetical protein [Marinomonas piezotolerans]RDL46189.1 hypothetical protein DN730_03900 [Marinomonas piezotolerans]
MLKATCIVILLASFAGLGYAKNFQDSVDRVIEEDPRNRGIKVTLESKHNDLWFCLKSLEDSVGPMDVFRVFLRTAERLQEESFESVKLCYGNTERFILSGDEYHVIGSQLPTQNVIYTIRTFPEKLVLPNGSPAFDRHRGGVLYQMKWQMRDFQSMNEQWYLSDIIDAREAKKEARRPKTFAPDEEVF